MASAKDPVCGMEVDTATDLHFEYDGETYYFCGRGCKLEFLRDANGVPADWGSRGTLR